MIQDPRLVDAYEKAKTLVGLREIRGDEDNPLIVKMFERVGHGWVKDDETAWCAAFVGSMLEDAGLESTRKLNARSYMNWEHPIGLEKAMPGDLVVFWRESANSWKGHVGFYVSHGKTYINVLGGNQGNSVSVAQYKRSRLLSVRTMRVAAPEKSGGFDGLLALLRRIFG